MEATPAKWKVLSVICVPGSPDALGSEGSNGRTRFDASPLVLSLTHGQEVTKLGRCDSMKLIQDYTERKKERKMQSK